jgi:hypothetical protein
MICVLPKEPQWKRRDRAKKVEEVEEVGVTVEEDHSQ